MQDHPENDSQYKGLNVNSGVAQPPQVNPYLNKRPKRKPLPAASELIEGILKGDVTMLSRAVTLVESIQPAHQAIAQEVIEKCLPYSGKSRRIGITGVPGAGKSTSIDVFGLHVLKQGGKLAVLAIDPSSERTKGSILGDKTRMEKLSQHHGAFIRPSPWQAHWGAWLANTRNHSTVRSRRIQQHIRRNRRRRTERNSRPLHGRLLPAHTARRHRRRTPGHKTRHHGDGRRHRHQQSRWRQHRPPRSSPRRSSAAPCTSFPPPPADGSRKCSPTAAISNSESRKSGT